MKITIIIITVTTIKTAPTLRGCETIGRKIRDNNAPTVVSIEKRYGGTSKPSRGGRRRTTAVRRK